MFEKNDSDISTPMMRQYHAIKKKYADCLLFYRMGDFFELFLDDAITASKELDITLTKRGRQANGEDIPMCGVPAHSYEIYLSKLIQKGYRVAICDQTETPDQARKRGAKGPLNREIVRIVTSGTLTEDNLLTANNNYLLAISPFKKDKQPVGIAIADISTGFFGVEYVASNDLFNTVMRWNPSEVILSDTTFTHLSTNEEWNIWKNKLTILPELRFDSTNAQHLLESIYNVQTLDVFGKMHKEEIQAAGVLVDYVMTTQCCRNISLLPPKMILSKEFLTIDAATCRNLELVVSNSENENSSLLAVLDQTVTAAGKRLLVQRLSSPLLDISKIDQRLDTVEIFVQDMALCYQVREILKSTYDIERIISRMSLNRVSPRDLGALRATLHKSQVMQKLLEQCFANTTWNASLIGYDSLIQLLDDALIDELPVYANNGDFIADHFNEQLDEVRQLKRHSSETLMALQSEYSQKTGINTLKIKQNNVWGIYIEVSASQTAKVPFDFIHRQTLTNCSRYTTHELLQLEQAINQAESKALLCELNLFNDICAQVLQRKNDLLNFSHTLAEIDVTATSAFLAVKNHYVRPTFSKDPILEIKNGRHPVVEQTFTNHEQSFSGNDCSMDAEHQRFLLLTGPNMAGKSTYLRQNALIIIMAQMGMFVPADEAVIGIVDRIFSRIGAADDLAYGRSTFMVEMIETSMILHQATSQSFIILDEIGRGTATYDGLAIAWAVSEYLYDHIQGRTLFATHYHELTQLTEQCPAMIAMTAAVREWENKIIFLHKIVKGAGQKSYGIHVAQLAGLPKSIIHRATELLQIFEKDIKVNTHNIAHKPRKTSFDPSQQELF